MPRDTPGARRPAARGGGACRPRSPWGRKRPPPARGHAAARRAPRASGCDPNRERALRRNGLGIGPAPRERTYRKVERGREPAAHDRAVERVHGHVERSDDVESDRIGVDGRRPYRLVERAMLQPNLTVRGDTIRRPGQHGRTARTAQLATLEDSL